MCCKAQGWLWHQGWAEPVRLISFCFRLTACLLENVIFRNQNYLRIQVRFSERFSQKINRTGRRGSCREVKTSHGWCFLCVTFQSLTWNVIVIPKNWHLSKRLKKGYAEWSIWVGFHVCINCFIRIWQKHWVDVTERNTAPHFSLRWPQCNVVSLPWPPTKLWKLILKAIIYPTSGVGGVRGAIPTKGNLPGWCRCTNPLGKLSQVLAAKTELNQHESILN